MMLTMYELAACTGARVDRAQMFLPHLQEAMDAFEITTAARATPFLANVGHESGGLKYTIEVWGPTPAQSGYEGRKDLGNTQPGDGSKFRGHGLFQTTGRYNHARVRDRLRAKFPHLSVPDFEAEPAALAEPRWAALSAGDYVADRRLNDLADLGDFEEYCAKINGRNRATRLPNGYEHRLALWTAAQKVLVA